MELELQNLLTDYLYGTFIQLNGIHRYGLMALAAYDTAEYPMLKFIHTHLLFVVFKMTIPFAAYLYILLMLLLIL